jgi:hypothetical protein
MEPDEYYLVSHPWTYELDDTVGQFLSYRTGNDQHTFCKHVMNTRIMQLESLAIETYSHSRVKESVK